MKRKTPQQKKAESYARDRRSTYGNNDKAARKAVPRRRQQRAQAERRIARQVLGGPAAANDEARIDEMLDRVAQKRRTAWRKCPDQPLGAVLARKRERRGDDHEDEGPRGLRRPSLRLGAGAPACSLREVCFPARFLIT